MAGEISGTDVLLLVNVGTEASPNYQAVGSQSSLSREETRDTIETSNKGNEAKTFIYGKLGSTLSLDAFYVPTNADFNVLKDAIRNRKQIKVRIDDEANSRTEEADCLVTSFPEEYPDNDAATLSLELQVTGSWSAV